MANQEDHLLSRRFGAGRTAGSLSVEMAFLAPLLALMLFGTVELGMMLKDVMVLNSAAREAARSAALGATNTEIVNRAIAAATTINIANLTAQLDYRTYSYGAWSAWTPLTTVGGSSQNSAPSGAQIRVILNYPHPLIAGRIFTSMLASNTSANTASLRATMVMMRE